MKRTLSVVVMDQPGVLNRVAGMFARRGFNIDSLAVGKTEAPGISRMTIVADEDDQTAEQVTKQLHKIVDVIKVVELDKGESVGRELALVKVSTSAERRAEILKVVEVFRGQVVDFGRNALVVEVTGDPDKVDAFIDVVKTYGIKEIVRTGKIAMARSSAGREPGRVDAPGQDQHSQPLQATTRRK